MQKQNARPVPSQRLWFGGFTNIALIIIIVLIAGGVGYYFAKQGAKQETVQTEPIVQEEEKEKTVQTSVVTGNNCIQIDNLSQGDQVSFPLTITGILNPNAPNIPISDCIRIFEGEAGFVGVIDQNSNNLVTGLTTALIIRTTSNWMVNAPVSFIVEIPSLTAQPVNNDIQIIISGGNDPRDNPPPPPPEATFVLNVTI